MDVPEESVELYSLTNQPDVIKRFSRDVEHEFFVPRDFEAVTGRVEFVPKVIQGRLALPSAEPSIRAQLEAESLFEDKVRKQL